MADLKTMLMRKPTAISKADVTLLPKFLRRLAEKTFIAVDSPNRPGDVGEYRGGDTIYATRPDLFDDGVLTHEMTHRFQASRNSAFERGLPKPNYGSDPYDYGDLDGLEQALRQGKTISDFNVEQQAAIVKTYDALRKWYAKPGLAPDAVKYFERIRNAYEPFIRQLVAVPDESNVGNTIDTRPRTPGLPSANITGILEQMPEMGGVPILLRGSPKKKK